MISGESQLSPPVSICAMVRDEAPYLEEWVAFHLIAGVGSIRLYDNGSTDATLELVQRISTYFPIEVVTWTHIRDTHDMVQKAAYDNGARYFAGRSEFVAFIDADEFVFCEGRASLPEALRRLGPNVGAVAVNQRIFGSSGLRQRTPGLVTSRFTRRAAPGCPEHLYFKTIARPECIDRFDSVHSVILNAGSYVFSDGSALETTSEHPGKAAHIRFGEIRLHHYPLKSLAEYHAKQRRFANTDLALEYDNAYFVNRLVITNAVVDGAAAGYAGTVAAAMHAMGQTLPAAPDASSLAVVHRNLIIDIGMSEGNDTQFYLDKGFDVVGVEADPIMFDTLVTRFASAIADGSLTLVNRAAAGSDEEAVTFYRNDREQGHSSLNQSHGMGDKRQFQVSSIDWIGLQAIRGVPYYLKIDIQTGEQPFLRTMFNRRPLPTFISVECRELFDIEMLYDLGYRKFKLVNQTILDTFARPYPPLEGTFLSQPNWQFASGPFGLELPGAQWFDFAEVIIQFDLLRRLSDLPSVVAPCWFDCHATDARQGEPLG